MFMIWFGIAVIIWGIIELIFGERIYNSSAGRFVYWQRSDKYTFKQSGLLFILVGIGALCIGIFQYGSDRFLEDLADKWGIER